MKKIKNVSHRLNTRLQIDARQAGITRVIKLENFELIETVGKNKIRFTTKAGKIFWLYNLKDSTTTFNLIVGNLELVSILIPDTHVLEEDSITIKESVGQALSLAFQVSASSEELLRQGKSISLDVKDLDNLNNCVIPSRFNSKLGVKVLGLVLFQVLGTPPYFKANASRYWTTLLKRCKNYKNA